VKILTLTFDKLNINLGKTYAKLRIFAKIFCKLGPRYPASRNHISSTSVLMVVETVFCVMYCMACVLSNCVLC